LASKTKKNETAPAQEAAAVKEPVSQENPQTEQPKETAQAGEDVVTLTKEEFEQVRAHIEQLQKDREEAINVAQRLQADFDNFRKRNASIRTDSYDEGVRECIKALLPALDNFERAMSSAQTPDEAWAKGVELVYRQLVESLGNQGLKELEAQGKFDPNFHNAVMQEAVEGKESGEILEVFQKGYEAKGKIIRYSMVKVAE